MKADERQELESNALVEGVRSFVHRAKAGRLVNPYVGAVLLAVAVGGGLWWYLASEGRKLRSRQWADLSVVSTATSESTLDEFIKGNKDSVAAKVARLDVARLQLGPEGLGKLNSRDRDGRNKAVESVAKARDALVELADEFKGDPTLRATCLLSAAEAELALVGVPKDASGGSRGAVDRAADLYRQAADVVGDKSPAAETFRKRADELIAKKDEIVRIGSELEFRQFTPSTFEGPKAPSGPLPPIGAIPTPGDRPKAPTTIPVPTPPTDAGPPAVPPAIPPTGTPAAPPKTPDAAPKPSPPPAAPTPAPPATPTPAPPVTPPTKKG